MHAVRFTRWQRAPELVEIATPEPGPGEVLLEVDAAGLCHSDLHIMEWPEGTLPYTLPFTLGHETAGTVAALGPKATGVSVGDRVLVYSRWGCGSCWHCRQGMENVCERSAAELGGHGGRGGRGGGVADHMGVAPGGFPLPPGHGERLRAVGRRARRSWRRRRPRRWTRRLHGRAVSAIPRAARGPRPGARRPPQRRRADALPRHQALPATAAPERQRGRHR